MVIGELVAVYGTLKHGERNHDILSHCRLHSVERVEGFEMWDLGAYPAVTLSPNQSTILVEVYVIDSGRTAALLDQLEGYPRLYNRKQIRLEDDEEAWIYFMETKPNNNKIETGVW